MKRLCGREGTLGNINELISLTLTFGVDVPGTITFALHAGDGHEFVPNLMCIQTRDECLSVNGFRGLWMTPLSPSSCVMTNWNVSFQTSLDLSMLKVSALGSKSHLHSVDHIKTASVDYI